MLATIGQWLADNIEDTFGEGGDYDDVFFRVVSQTEVNPPQTFPYLYVIAGPFRPQVVEFGGLVADWQYQFTLTGGVFSTTREGALTLLETMAKRLADWCVENSSLNGLTDGNEAVYENMPGPITPLVRGANQQWMGVFNIPYVIKTTSL